MILLNYWTYLTLDNNIFKPSFLWYIMSSKKKGSEFGVEKRKFKLADLAGLEDHNKIILIWEDQLGFKEYQYWDPDTTITVYKVLDKMFKTPLGKQALKDHNGRTKAGRGSKTELS